jgi:glycosyltransferase involved in cell wall biosynthesis
MELSIGGVHILPVAAAMIDERFEQFTLPGILEELGIEVYLNTTFSVPAIKTTRIQASIIHDVVFEDHPEYVGEGLRRYLSEWSRFAAAHADHVVTVSDHARDRIQSVYGVSPSRITRIYNGISPSCFDAPSARALDQVRTKFGIDRSFILYLGSIEAKKGIVQLLRAYRKAADAGLAEMLLLAGGKGGAEFDLESQARAAGCSDRVRSLGFVEEEDKKALLRACDLFVYPSLYEGFGLPPLEAMALGVPTVVSDRTCLPEIVGDAALAAKIEEPDQFAEVLRRGLSDPEFRRNAALAGPIQARKYSWQRSASQLLALCERVGGN